MGIVELIANLKENWKIYVGGLIIVAALGVAGQYANQYRSLKTQLETVTQDSQKTTAELQRQISDAHEQLKQARTESSTYKHRWAQLTADGKVALDGHGDVVYNEDTGDSEVSDVLEQEAQQHAEKMQQKDEYIKVLEAERLETLQRITKPTSAGWGPAFSVDAPAWSNLDQLREWYGADLDLALAGWRVNCAALVGPPADRPVFDNDGLKYWGARLQISLH